MWITFHRLARVFTESLQIYFRFDLSTSNERVLDTGCLLLLVGGSPFSAKKNTKTRFSKSSCFEAKMLDLD